MPRNPTPVIIHWGPDFDPPVLDDPAVVNAIAMLRAHLDNTTDQRDLLRHEYADLFDLAQRQAGQIDEKNAELTQLRQHLYDQRRAIERLRQLMGPRSVPRD